MADADVNVRMTGSTADAQQAWLSIIAVLNNVEAALKRIQKTGRTAGKDVGKEMNTMAASAGRFANAVASVVGIGGPLAAMLTTVQAIRREVDLVIATAEQGADFNIRRERALSAASGASVGRLKADGTPLTNEDIDRIVRDISQKRNISQLALFKGLEAGFAAGGELNADEIIETVSRTAEVIPQLALPESGEDLAGVAVAMLELQKAERSAGRDISSDQAIAAFFTLFKEARAENIKEFAGPFISSISQAALTTGGIDTLGEIGAIITTIGQAAVDPAGRRSATNMLTAMERFQKALLEEDAAEFKGKGFTERIDMLAEGKTPATRNARRRLLGVFDPDVTDDMAKSVFSEFGQGTPLGEQRMEAILRGMITKGSKIRDLLALERERIGDPTSQETVSNVLSQLSKNQQMTPVLQSEISKQVAKESAQVAARDEAILQQIINTSEEAIKLATTGALPGAGFAGFMRGFPRAFSALGSQRDPVKEVEREVAVMTEAITQLTRRLARSQGDVRLDLESRIESLTRTRDTIQGRLEQLRNQQAGERDQQLLPSISRAAALLDSSTRDDLVAGLAGIPRSEQRQAAIGLLKSELAEVASPSSVLSRKFIQNDIDRLEKAIQFLAETQAKQAFTDPGLATELMEEQTEALNRNTEAIESSRQEATATVPAAPPLREQ